jgi:hypothetical protein
MWPRARLLSLVLTVAGRQASRKSIRSGRAFVDKHCTEPRSASTLCVHRQVGCKGCDGDIKPKRNGQIVPMLAPLDDI